jgi:hypothetical protein
MNHGRKCKPVLDTGRERWSHVAVREGATCVGGPCNGIRLRAGDAELNQRLLCELMFEPEGVAAQALAVLRSSFMDPDMVTPCPTEDLPLVRALRGEEVVGARALPLSTMP